ncbi:MAG: DNA-binding response regulator [Bacteroidetes bacterium]|jgi:DNA-binding NarL/FixJ family response regulator|nr:DNA-binding response regulator [Bacteroidota bacterium]
MKKHSAVVADDHPIFRKGLIDILKDLEDLEIVAEVSDGLEAYRQILSRRPDLAILDIEMPGLTGIDVCSKVMNEKSDTKFIVLTMHKDLDFFNDAMNVGVHGYLLKDNAITELILCIKAVLKGERFISPGIEKQLVQKDKGADMSVLETLTSTELIILKLIAESKTSPEIAKLLFISAKTVENHRSNMTKKLNLEGKNNSLLKFAMQYKGLL